MMASLSCGPGGRVIMIDLDFAMHGIITVALGYYLLWRAMK